MEKRRIVLEGDPNTITNLLALMLKSHKPMPNVRNDYQSKNLWGTSDVTYFFECSEKEAMEVLEEVLTSLDTIQSIMENIELTCRTKGFKEKEI